MASGSLYARARILAVAGRHATVRRPSPPPPYTGGPDDGRGATHFLLIGAIAGWLTEAMVPLALLGLIRRCLNPVAVRLPPGSVP